MKKVIIGLLLICVVAGLVAVGTWAAFRDVETSTDNLFVAGSMDLKVDGEDDPIKAYFDTITCVKPGDSAEVEIELSNVGCVDGLADIHIFITESDENIAVEPELNVGDTEDDLGNMFDGELAAKLEMKISADLDNNGTYETPVAEGSVGEIACTNYVYGALNAGTSIWLLIEWWVPAEVGNIIMTDTLEFEIEFSLDQAMAACLTVISIDQPDQVQECELVDISVDVKNQGGAPGECDLNVTVTYPDASVLASAVVPTGSVDPLETVEVLIFDDLHIEVTDPSIPTPYTLTVTATSCCGDPKTCEIVVTDPPALHVVDMIQPEVAYHCEELIVEVGVHNDGGKPGECFVTVMVLDALLSTPTEPVLIMAPMTLPVPVVAPCDTVWVPVNLGHVEEYWPELILVLASACADDPMEPYMCLPPITVLPPPLQPSSEWIYDVHYDTVGAVPPAPDYSDDTVLRIHLLGVVDPIPDLLPACVPLTPLAGPGALFETNPAWGGVQPTRYITQAGTTMDMQTGLIDNYTSVLDGTGKYTYMTATAMLGLVVMGMEVNYDNYILTSGAGTNIGKPYTAGSSWTYDAHTVSHIPLMGGCQAETVVTYTVTVAGPMADPTGTYPNCMQVTIDDPLVPGTRVEYHDSAVHGNVYVLNTETYEGTETQTLTSYTLVW